MKADEIDAAFDRIQRLARAVDDQWAGFRDDADSEADIVMIERLRVHAHLLARYIEHVGMVEGAHFLGDYQRTSGPIDPPFTDEEWAMLQQAAGIT